MNLHVKLAAGFGIGAVTLRRMITEFDRDGALSATTAGVLDGLYAGHLAAVVAVSRRDRRTLPVAPSVAVAVVAAGTGLTAAGMRRFPSVGQLNATGHEKLVTGGIYRWTRNPQYLGWSLVLAGTALVHRSWRGLALAAVYPAAIRVWLPHEERGLERRFGDAYQDYRRRVRRWIGRSTSGQEHTHG